MLLLMYLLQTGDVAQCPVRREPRNRKKDRDMRQLKKVLPSIAGLSQGATEIRNLRRKMKMIHKQLHRVNSVKP